MKLNHALYTVEEARDLLGLKNTSTVRSYLIGGLLEGIKVKGFWLVKGSSLQEKLERQRLIDKRMKAVK